MKKVALLMLLSVLCSVSGHGQNWSQMAKVVPDERALNDQFGFSVAISGDYAIIGCHREDEDANGENYLEEAGAAYIYKREGCTWVLQQKIVASDRKAGRQFGLQVTIQGEYAFVGTYIEDEDANGNNPLPVAGALYVFKNISGNWTQVQKIVAPIRAEQDFFSYDFSVSGDILVIGAYAEDEDENEINYFLSSGSVYVYKNIGGVWTFQQKIVATDRGYLKYFGFSVDIQENTIIIGSYNDPHDENGSNYIMGSGSVYFFNFNGSQWVQTQKITSYERQQSNWFGYRVKLSGDYAFIGVQREAEDENGGNTLSFAGAVYVLHNNGSNWVHHQKLVAPDRAVQDFFGNNIASSNNFLLVSAYREDEDSIGLNTLADAGSAYLFRNHSGNWLFEQKICPADRGVGDFFSLRLAIDGDYILLSSSLDDEDVSGENTLSNAGSAYFFRNTDGAPCDQFDACAAIEELSEAVNNSSIPNGLKNSLTSKLNAAQSSFQNGQNTAAINKLNAFINEVQAQSGKKIPAELASGWIAEALEIIEAIESGEAVCGENNEELKNIKSIKALKGDPIQNKLNVYPNTVSDKIHFNAILSSNATLILTDISGRIMYQTEVLPIPGDAIYSIGIEKLNLESGYYHLSILHGHEIFTNKIFIFK